MKAGYDGPDNYPSQLGEWLTLGFCDNDTMLIL